MRDQWTRIVAEQLAGLELPDDERDEVIEEVATHLRECAEELDAAGVTDAAERALAQVSDWRQLAARIRRAKEERMSAMGITVPPGMSSARSHRRMLAWVMTITVLGGAAAGLATSWLMPVRYRSQALLQVVPPQVSSDYIRMLSPRPLDDRMRDIRMTVLSRTRLERMINDFNLYPVERASLTMEEVTRDFRDQISIQSEVPAGSLAPANAISVSYTGANAITVMKVTERLAGYMKDESQVEMQRRAESTMAYLEAQSEEVGMRLQAQQTRITASRAAADRRSQMETQVLESTYVKLLGDLEQARMQVNLERRQIGEQFTLLDQARVPEYPIGPTRGQYVGLGALAGLSLGVLVVLVLSIARLWSSNRPQPVTQIA